jgi:hypothetical protein
MCSFLTALQEMRVQPAGALSPGDSPPGESLVQEGRLLLEVSALRTMVL